MKTAKDWYEQIDNGLPHRPINIDDIEQIQLDAFKAGMKHASHVLKIRGCHTAYEFIMKAADEVGTFQGLNKL